MEQNGNMWNMLEATVSYSTWARLTPTLTHVVAYKLATSGAEDGAMSTTVVRMPRTSISSVTSKKKLWQTSVKLSNIPCHGLYIRTFIMFVSCFL